MCVLRCASEHTTPPVEQRGFSMDGLCSALNVQNKWGEVHIVIWNEMLPVGRVLLVRHVSTLECDWLSRRKEKTSVPEEEVCQFSFAWKMSEKSLISSLSSYFLNCCFYCLLSGLTVLFYFPFKKSVFQSTFFFKCFICIFKCCFLVHFNVPRK